jgi:hypothetical protein
MVASRRGTLLATCGLIGATAASAQMKPPETAPATFSMSKEYRDVQKSALQTQRKLLLSFADSMPEKLYRDKATPAQRDFAQQVHHIASAVGAISAIFIKGGKFTDGDTTAAFGSRAGLKAYINQQYDAADATMAGQTDADRDLKVKFFGGKFIPKWQVWDELNQHSLWTAGQIVANFRKNGMAPPMFLFF